MWTSIPLPGGSYRGPFVRILRSSSSDSAFDIWVGAGVNLLKTTCASIDSARTLTSSDWSALSRPAGLHDDSGYLGLNSQQVASLVWKRWWPF